MIYAFITKFSVRNLPKIVYFLQYKIIRDNQIQSKKRKNIGYRRKLYYFFRSPIIKFCYNQIFFIIFLLLFSYIILCNFFPIEYLNEDGIVLGKKISEIEFLLMGWVFVFFLDEIRQLSNIAKFKEITLGKFFSDFWNLVQLTSIFLFGIGIGFRFVPDYNFYLAARIILSIDIICWFFCGLHGYSVIRSLGPKLLMIQKMLNELAVFLLIVVVFIFAYGISSQSLMYHNQELDLSLLKSVFLPAYFVIGGEYFEREKLMDIDECHSNLTQLLITDTYTQEDCPEKYGASVSLFLLVVYIMLLNILLVNLLIAIFSNTYENVESEADKIWKFQRYRLFLLGKCLNCKFKEAISLNSNFFATSEKNRLKLWESFIAEEYLNKCHIQMNNQEQKNKEMLSKLVFLKFDCLNSKIDRLTEIQNNNENTIKILQKKLDLLVEGEVKKSFEEIQDQTKISKNPLKSIAENNRIEYYPESKVAKKLVPFGKVKWSELYTEYYPNEYTSENVLYNLTADAELLNKFTSILENFVLQVDSLVQLPGLNLKGQDLFTGDLLINIFVIIFFLFFRRKKTPDEYREKIKFNSLDDTSGLDRTSCLGNYIVKNGVPLNPKGRQGISGRGSLHFWGKMILEFVVAIKINSKWRFPSIMQEKLFKIDELIEQKLIGEIFDIDRVDIEDMRSMLIKPLNITKYYKESSYNTDNAWLEFTVLNYHDQGDKVFSKLKLKFLIILQDFYDGKRLEWVVANDLTITNLSYQDSKHIKRLLRLHQFSNLF
ncbi:transient receptor potential cation channel subfamily M member 2-like [Brachionus plicatilis]|uniref:Transient receptor potential cation channel subfamily M member 2-like n=1 Tax=Brachionus plicatilis TaxID=10195 RepID=A0A3M7Q517_BRAPC|nr:transient receptor potential cation channel subfamily M member 2-like [Brachionus plicatilis]